MKNIQRKNNLNNFLSYVITTISITTFLILSLTLKNECIFLQGEVYHLKSIQASHINRVKILKGDIKNLSRQDRIEKLAFDSFMLHVPTPESLVVYLENIE